MVIAGKHKGKISTIKEIKDIVNARKITNRYVYLEGVNVMKKAVKKQWFKEVTLPIHISNVQYYDEEAGKSSRVGIRVVDGKKVRYLKKTNKNI